MPGLRADLVAASAPKGPGVITETLIRNGIQADDCKASSPELRRSMSLAEVQSLAISFQCIGSISNLQGLTNLTKLALENNGIKKIENLDHLVKLTQLDLSFNCISSICGLGNLTALQDLSLFSNNISSLEGLEPLSQLCALSMGRNKIGSLAEIGSLRQFRRLQLVNMLDNPVTLKPDYHGFILSRLSSLVYLDYRRVNPAEIQAALEQHQDEMNEIREREAEGEAAGKAAAEWKAHAARLQEANLDGVETLWDDIVANDPEWNAKLMLVPGLTDAWSGELRETFTKATEEFVAHVFEQTALKRQEVQEFQAALDKAMNTQNKLAEECIVAFAQLKKRASKENAARSMEGTALVAKLPADLEQLECELMSIEEDAISMLSSLVSELEQCHADIAASCLAKIGPHFSVLRDLDIRFYDNANNVAATILDKYSQENPDLDALPEEVRGLVLDKEQMTAALQASKEQHLAFIDVAEDGLAMRETRQTPDLVASKLAFLEERYRRRMAEIGALVDQQRAAVESLMTEED
ncbi:hypothetical protein WJX84_003821 [Apatococcus fuscideae]|uniref:Dynein regulatory complex subunit 3 n=1 Tax=Apatococcus fuscideae TaxID=2026836 RepID=A0AAW1TE84_9CHLO